MAKALYRKYRPRKLDEVVGQSQVTDILASSLKQGKISHAYLFIGPRGTGKTSVARIFAHEINGFSYEIEDDYVDIIEIDGASNRGIDNIRELREKALIAPTSGKYKVYIIDEVHMLTKEAFNALLKILEEPPKHVIFIMATTDAYKVPVTITSRAQVYTFTLADSKTMLAFLEEVAKKEGIKIEPEVLSLIVRRGGGSFRDSLSLLDQISTLTSDLITKEMVVLALGLPADEKIAELLKVYLSGDVVEITTILKDLLSSGIKAETLAEEMISFIIENPEPEYFKLLEKLPEVKAPFAEAKLLVALASKIISFESRLELEKSHTLGSRENRPSGEPLGAGRNIDFSNSNQTIKLSKETISDAKFNWEDFLEKVREANDAIYSQLLKTTHSIENGVLIIFPERKIVKTILSRENNLRVMTNLAGDIKIEIRDAGENKTKDETLARFSDIMGGEVINDGGKSPF